jgi:hypothetical protein
MSHCDLTACRKSSTPPQLKWVVHFVTLWDELALGGNANH